MRLYEGGYNYLSVISKRGENDVGDASRYIVHEHQEQDRAKDRTSRNSRFCPNFVRFVSLDGNALLAEFQESFDPDQ